MRGQQRQAMVLWIVKISLVFIWISDRHPVSFYSLKLFKSFEKCLHQIKKKIIIIKTVVYRDAHSVMEGTGCDFRITIFFLGHFLVVLNVLKDKHVQADKPYYSFHIIIPSIIPHESGSPVTYGLSAIVLT